MSLFKRTLSREEFEQEVTPEVEVSEIVEATAENDDVNEIAADIQADVSSIEEAEEVIEELDEQVEENEAALETPEAVEAIDVAVSQEALSYATKRLGTTMADMNLGVISRESAKEDAVTALRLSTEGVKEFIATVIEQIKRLMKNVGMAFKKLYVKALTVLNNTEKSAKKLQEKTKTLKDSAKSVYSEEEKVWYGEKLAAVAKDGLNKANLEKFITEANDVSKITSGIEAIEKNIMAVINATEEELLSEDFKGIVSVVKGEEPLLSLSDGGKKYVNYVVENYEDPAKAAIKKVAGENDVQVAISKVSSVLKVADVDSVLKKLIASGNKKYYEVMKKHIDKLDQDAVKAYKAISDASNWSTQGRAKRVREISRGLSMSTSICLDAVVYNLRANKNIVNVCSKALSFHDIKTK